MWYILSTGTRDCSNIVLYFSLITERLIVFKIVCTWAELQVHMLILLSFQAEVCGESKCPNCLFQVWGCIWLITTTSSLSEGNSLRAALIYTTESGTARLVANFILVIHNCLELFWNGISKTSNNNKSLFCAQVWDPHWLQSGNIWAWVCTRHEPQCKIPRERS